MLNPNILRLYAITDRRYLKNIELKEAVEKAILGGVTCIQLREKNISDNELLNLALDIKAVTKKYNIPLIINDNVYLAKEIDADGVHLGADDTEIEKARLLLGNNKIIGGTARTLERALTAEKQGADYLGIGAVFNTTTKAGTTTMTRELSQKINSTVKIPTVAIGGISRDNVIELNGYGVKGIAVVSSIFSGNDILGNTKALLEALNKTDI